MELPSNQTIARFFLLTYVSMVIATWWGLPIRVVGQATDVIFASPFFCSSLLAAALIFYASYRERKEKLVVFAIGLALEIGLAVLRMRKGLEFGELYGLFGMGLGTVALFHLLRKSIRKDAGDKLRNLAHEVALLPIFVLASGPMLRLALMMLPRVYDHYFIYLDATFYPYFGQPSVALLSGSPLLYRLCIWVYESLPLALGVAHILAKPEHPTGERSALLLLFVMLGGAGWIVYALVPVIGPGPFVDTFGATSFDNPSLALTGIVDTYKAARNCVPSLHTAWALAAFLAVPTRLRAAKVGFGIFLFLTLLATLGLKAHYFVDLVLGVPFAIGLRALVESAQPGLSSEQLRTRRQTAATSAVLFIITLSLYVTYPSQLAAIPPANWLQAGACVAIPLLMHRRAKLANSTAPAIEADYVATTATLPAFSRTVTALFVASGLSALIIEVVISRSMALTFGSTSTAQSTVLATYMGGMALGAWWGGKRASAAKTPIRMYAHCELAIAGYTLCAPYLMGLAQQLYVALMQGQNYPAAVTTGVQFLLGALILSPPTILMGATMPALLAHFSRGGENIAPAVARLYAANTAGAAIGALSAAYFFLPNFGVQGTVAFACAFSLFAALGALRRAKNIDGAIEATAQASTPAASHDAIAPEPLPQAATVLTQRRIALAVLSIGGVVTLALEGIYVHLLAVVVGCSSYAFGLMLACFLAALGMGSIAARKLFASQRSPESMLAWAQLAIFAATTGGLFIWNEIPGYFASFASSPFMHSFAAREWVRFFVCVVAMAPPAFFIGMSYPCAMTLFVESHPENRVAAMGRASAINTVGNVLGALLGGFALIPMLGSYHAILLLGFLSGSLALAATLSLAKTARISLIAAALTVCAIALTMPSDFDYTRLASGANVYFAQQGYGKVIDHVESMDGGLTTVNLSHDANGEVHTLLTNGKFQGDDSLQREAKAQYGFGLVPLLQGAGA